MRSNALKKNDFYQESTGVTAKAKRTHLRIAASQTQQEAPASEYGADLGAFEEHYLLGACFA